jgi:MFS transporter, YNFM family, putative membrane transport protein
VRGSSSLFASFLFLGQSLGVVLAAALIDRMGTSAAGGGVIVVEGAYFGWALRRIARLESR